MENEISASIFWKKLKNLYERKIANNKLYVFKIFVNLKYKGGTLMADHLNVSHVAVLWRTWIRKKPRADSGRPSVAAASANTSNWGELLATCRWSNTILDAICAYKIACAAIHGPSNHGKPSTSLDMTGSVVLNVAGMHKQPYHQQALHFWNQRHGHVRSPRHVGTVCIRIARMDPAQHIQILPSIIALVWSMPFLATE